LDGAFGLAPPAVALAGDVAPLEFVADEPLPCALDAARSAPAGGLAPAGGATAAADRAAAALTLGSAPVAGGAFVSGATLAADVVVSADAVLVAVGSDALAPDEFAPDALDARSPSLWDADPALALSAPNSADGAAATLVFCDAGGLACVEPVEAGPAPAAAAVGGPSLGAAKGEFPAVAGGASLGAA
jgi:hypothetical protein